MATKHIIRAASAADSKRSLSRPARRSGGAARSRGSPDKPVDAPPPAAPYEPTPREEQAVKAYFDRRSATPPSPRIKVAQQTGKPGQLEIDHPDQQVGAILLQNALGSADTDFANGVLIHLAGAAGKGQQVDTAGLNFMLAMVKGIGPRDQVETMLAAQMAAVHNATMTFARRLNHVENLPQQDSAERAFNKLARTFAAQIEALKRYRSSGEQVVRVEHVDVHAGGQAIVGAVTHQGGGGVGETGDRPHALADARQPAMPGNIEAEREAVPLAGGEGQGRLQDARRRRRRA